MRSTSMWIRAMLLLSYVLVSVNNAHAEIHLDIRAASPFVAGAGTVDYVGFISDCRQVSEIRAGGETDPVIKLAASEAQRSLQTELGCEIQFTLSGVEKFSPFISTSFIDGSEIRHDEQFNEEKNQPSLSLESVSIEENDQQYLIVTVNANDDSDISYLSYDIVGLLGSELSRVGGVVEHARELAFAETSAASRHFPVRENQEKFNILVPLKNSLSSAEIASDGVVLVEVTVVDSSGNQKSISELALTGENIQEKVLGFNVAPEKIIFNSALEVAQIIPSVEFQFRGLTPLPGVGNDVSYTSTHPDLVQVTPDGFVYPLKETGSISVFVEVSYPGVEPLTIPIEVDYSKTLTGLTWVGNGQSYELVGLNKYHPLPELSGVFNDGSSAPLNSLVKPVITLPQGSENILRYDPLKGFISSAELPQGLLVNVALDRYTEIDLELPITAIDKAPTLSFNAPSQGIVGSTLLLKAIPKDDVGIQRVEFLLDGNVVGSRDTAPYELSIPISEQLEGQTLSVAARAVDTKGQSAQTNDSSISIVGTDKFEFPDHQMTLPADGARIVEGTPFIASVEIELEGGFAFSSGVNRVEFYADGTKIGDVRYPVLKQKTTKAVDQTSGAEISENQLTESWTITTSAPGISTNETSQVISAVLYSGTSSERSNSKQVVVVKNTGPVARILSPVAGSTATVGQTIEVAIEAVDDTLAAGTTIGLMIDGNIVNETTFRDRTQTEEGAYQYSSHKQLFSVPITEEMLGQTLQLQAQVTDFHEKVSLSEVRNLAIKSDQAPTVAVSYPAEGASLVSGLPVELRANASDDLEVTRVDFYVNDQLVGSDSKSPFATIYQTPENITNEQPLSIVAVATDSGQKTASSAPVNVTLGKDEIGPVINLASPAISGSDSGEDIAKVLEDSEFVFKVTGYDNVDVTSLLLEGVEKVDGQGYILTGNPDSHAVPLEDFVPQTIPGALNAFSALKLVAAPAFKNLEGVEFDSYQIRVTAFDKAGNSSQLEAVVGVFADRAPEIKQVIADKTRYFVNDTVTIETVAQDDRAVTEIAINTYVGSGTTPALSVIKNVGTGLTPAAEFVDRTQIDLASLNLSNETADLRFEVQVSDAGVTPKTSDWFLLQSQIQSDSEAPNVAIVAPRKGALLHHGDTAEFEVRVVDNSILKSFSVTHAGSSVHSRNIEVLEQGQFQEQFNVVLPDEGEEYILEVSATDVFGNVSAVSTWRYKLVSDMPPTVSIRSPAAGSRLTEGESVTVTASVADDVEVSSVEFFVKQGSATLQQKLIARDVIVRAIAEGKYLAATLRVPHRSDSESVEIGVRAVDSSGQSTTKLLDMEIVDDLEGPTISISEPNSPISILPGNAFNVLGTATDNIYVNDITPIMVADDGSEVELQWELIARNDNQEEVRVPNPGSLGGVLVATRFSTDFRGRVRIPTAFSENYGGQTFNLLFRAADLGVNTNDSSSVPITILEDIEGPAVVVTSPGETLKDRQSANVRLSISDNVAVSTYQVELLDDEKNRMTLGEEADLNEPLINWPGNTTSYLLDLTPYGPVTEERTLNLIVTANDLSGNQTIHNERIVIKPDQAPIVVIEKQDPDSNTLAGQLAKTLFLVEDDYIYYDLSNKLLALYSSLSGLGAGGTRDPTGLSKFTGNVDQLVPAKPAISVNYSESQGWVGDLVYEIDRTNRRHTYLEINNDQMIVHPLASSYELISGIGLVSNQAVAAQFAITVYSDESCSAQRTTYNVETTDGWLDLSSMVDDHTVAVNIDVVSPDVGFIHKLWINYNRNHDLGSISFDSGSVNVEEPLSITAIVSDDGNQNSGLAFVHSSVQAQLRSTTARIATSSPIPILEGLQKVSILAHVTDRMSHQREAVPLSVLGQQLVIADTVPPEIEIGSPSTGNPVLPGQSVPLSIQFSDQTSVLEAIQLLDNTGTVIRELGLGYGQSSVVVPYKVPVDIEQRELQLTVIGRDLSGNTSEYSQLFPVEVNEPPVLDLNAFSSYKVGGNFQSVITSPQRLNYAEFWVRNGEDFEVTLNSSDDSGLQSVAVYRLNRDGSYAATEYSEEYDNICPSKPVFSTRNKASIRFNQASPTEYKVVVTDNIGQVQTRSLLIHPLTNMAPEIRITSPAEAQQVAAGTFFIKVGIVASDDRELHQPTISGYGDTIKVLANGVPLELLDTQVYGESIAGGHEAIEQAFNSIHAAFERNYGLERADQYGTQDSPYAMGTNYVLAIPAGLINQSETLKLTAFVYDADNSVGIDEITINVEPDTIKPVPLITKPELGYGAVENSDFTIGYSGFDNVKVQQLSLEIAYGINDVNNVYQRTDFELLTSVNDIPALDFQPVSTVNIDAPEYVQLFHVPKLQALRDKFPSVAFENIQRFDIWVRVTAWDATSQESVELSYPVVVDQRPVIDIVDPLNGHKAVAETNLWVNVNAFDDVGLDYVKLIANYGNGQPQYEMRLRQPPYNYLVPMPEFDSENRENNAVTIEVEALDTYGAAFNDVDTHTARESISVEIIEDQPPVINFGQPKDGDSVTEGELMLVQINAIDDVGINQINLTVAGLRNGDHTFTDMVAPFEFLVQVPYGQAGYDLSLSATATEQRLGGDPRTVSTTKPVLIKVLKDTDAPEIQLYTPESNAQVVESRYIPYRMDVNDNVRVASVKLQVFAELDGLSGYTSQEIIQQRILVSPPYWGSIPLETISAYLPNAETLPDALDLEFRVTAVDGIGNESVVNRSLSLTRNLPPEVRDIRLLDSRGFSIGSAVEITEGRGVVLDVVAQDPEVGVDAATLFYAIGESSNSELEFIKLGEDTSAPFQFHLTIPTGKVGQSIFFKAMARDIDGNESDISPILRSLAITADQPPQAKIVKPENNGAVVIDGENIEVFVEVFDDLGAEGIDHVVFYVNNQPVTTVFDNYGSQTGNYAQDHLYRAELSAPDSVDGFYLHAIAYDVLGQAGASQEILIGRIKDTVEPKLSILYPLNGEILTTGETLRAVVSVVDRGDPITAVTIDWYREYQANNGEWMLLDHQPLNLFRDDVRENGDNTPVSDPENYYYIYWSDFTGSNILRRSGARNERVRAVASVVTESHTRTQESVYEIGLPISERRFIQPCSDDNSCGAGSNSPYQVHYTAVDQFQSELRDGAMIAAWSSSDPLKFEQGLSVPESLEGDPGDDITYTGLMLFDGDDETRTNEQGDYFMYSALLNGAAEIFSGKIGEIKADANVVIAAKSGSGSQNTEGNTFVDQLQSEISADWTVAGDSASGSGGLYLENTSGELLLFTVQNGDGQFGLPYLLAGRLDLPYPDVYSLDRKDDLVLVANGNGGVQVVDISNFYAPYRIGFIKPNGFARDVKVKGKFAFIAASHEGLVVADITDPSLPVVAVLDTLGVANRLHITGDRAYVADMSTDGLTSQFNVIDISDPYRPKMVDVVSLNPSRPDLVSDGVYDVYVSGNLAYATVHYSDQEDTPAQSVVEIVDLVKSQQPKLDASVPVMIHRQAEESNFAARGVTLARGAIQVAASRSGINRIDMPELTILAHRPGTAETDVKTDLANIRIELSAVLADDVVLANFIEVLEGDAMIGVPVTERFSLGFEQRDNEDNRRVISLTLLQGQSLLANTRYFVRIKAGLAPLTGNNLGSDYLYSFTTAVSGDADSPDIVSICALVEGQVGVSCSATGGIEGGTEILVRGHHFTGNPQITLGGQPLVVKQVELAGSVDEYDRLIATTVPNYPGPAAVTVINEFGLEDTVIGGFTYVDQLRISFLDPTVVNTLQAGNNDVVNIVGLGFHNGLTLKAYKHGSPDQSKTSVVDQKQLKLISPEHMEWQVPVFTGNGGQPYRGFVDVEISDQIGRHYTLPNALFYGRLAVNRTLETEYVLDAGFINNQMKSLDSGKSFSNYVTDALKLPPGEITSLAHDAELDLFYVLGRGLLGSGVTQPAKVLDKGYLDDYYAPGWLALVKYQRNDIANAAPMHGLGYYNLPQDLVAMDMALGDDYVYVTAQGYHFPHINTQFDNQSVVLVYERDKVLPENPDTENAAKDRNYIYGLPLPFNDAPRKIIAKDNLLIIGGEESGVVVLSLSNPARPTVISQLKTAKINTGAQLQMKVRDLDVVDDQLHVTFVTGPSKDGLVKEKLARSIFDLSKPSLPQIGTSLYGQDSAALDDVGKLATADELAVDVYVPSVIDSQRATYLRSSGQFDGNGFNVPGPLSGIAAGSTISANLTRGGISSFGQTDCGGFYEPSHGHFLNHNGSPDIERPANAGAYLSLYDLSQNDNIVLLDAVSIEQGCMKLSGYDVVRRDPVVYSDDGLIAFAINRKPVANDGLVSTFNLVDTLMPELVSSSPANGSQYVSLETQINLTFSQALNLSVEELASYVQLIKEDGSAAGQLLPMVLSLSDNAHRIDIAPNSPLAANTSYRIQLTGLASSRRTEGLMNHAIRFTTSSSGGANIQLVDVSPATADIDGSPIWVSVTGEVGTPQFLVAGANAPILASESSGDDVTRYQIQAPANNAGPAPMEVISANGTRDRILGALYYVDPLVLSAVSPQIGSINGGTSVRIQGQGFRGTNTQIQVYFGDVLAPQDSVKLLDPNTLEVITPAAGIGKVDVKVALADGQTGVLSSAYEYQQPVQANISGDGRIYDMVLDPTGTWAIVALGSEGVAIYNVAASTYTGDSSNPLNPDDLRQLIDRDRDGRDDRIETVVSLPDGYQALGVATFFENGADRVFVSAAKFKGEQPDSAKLFVISFDGIDINNSIIVNSLELPANFARGLEVRNNKVVMAMGNGGVGLVDAYLHSKLYLADQLPVDESLPVLDVTSLTAKSSTPDQYAFVGGAFDFSANKLVQPEFLGSGGFYLAEMNPVSGFSLLSQLDIPASRVKVQGDYAYLAAGMGGLVIVDISNLKAPQIVSRITDVGHVYDVDVNGHLAYLALGEKGIVTVDVTRPQQPIVTGGMEANAGNHIDVVVASGYLALGSGTLPSGNSVLQVIPDVVLKVFRVDPVSGILDADIDGNISARVRFNKAIDLYPENSQRFHLVTAQGLEINSSVAIQNNDATITINNTELASLSIGDVVTLVVDSGVRSAKPLQNDEVIDLYSLAQTQRFDLIYRGARPNAVTLGTLLPRRVPVNTSSILTLSGIGFPAALEDLRIQVGGLYGQLESIRFSDDDSQTAIVEFSVPAIEAAGQYDVVVEVNQSGLWQSAVLTGGLMVDEMLSFNEISPKWGPTSGGTVVEVSGTGFEPGNTVTAGLTISIGSLPVKDIEVLSTTRLRMTTPRGSFGKAAVYGEDRYGHEIELRDEDGFGYGLKRIAQVRPNLVHPTDVWVDQETGVAITNGGFLLDGDAQITLNGEVSTADTVRAASFDIQDPNQPLFVGGNWFQPSGSAAQLNAQLLYGENAEVNDFSAFGITSYTGDSVRIWPQRELEQGEWRKRLYVASGARGISRLNLDEQSGLQLINEVNYGQDQVVADLVKQGHALFATRYQPGASRGRVPSEPNCGKVPAENGSSGSIESLNYSDPFDPVSFGTLANMSGAATLHLQGEWLFSGGVAAGMVSTYGCHQYPKYGYNEPEDGASESSITALNIFDPSLTRQYSFSNSVTDMVSYGDYLFVAVARSGVEYFHLDRPEQRSVIDIDGDLQQSAGDARQLRIYGSTLFIAADSGVIVVDISDIHNPRVVSAGNTESIKSVDLYRDRLIAGGRKEGLQVFTLPGSLVMSASVEQGGLMSVDESQPLEIRFNELITTASLQQPGSVLVEQFDQTTLTSTPLAVTVEPVSDTTETDAASAFRVVFDRTPGAHVRLSVLSARNQRGQGLWSPFVRDFELSQQSAPVPVIAQIQNGQFYLGEQDAITLLGSGFDANSQIYVNQFAVTTEYLDENTLRIPSNALDMLQLDPGQHHIKVDNGGLSAVWMGALVVGTDRSRDQITFQMTPDNGETGGGYPIHITSSDAVFLPGSKVSLRTGDGNSIIETLTPTIDLKDNVVSLTEFAFIMPGVIIPDLYYVYVTVPTANGIEELYVGQFSYTFDGGLGISLPNYPPMEIGAAKTRDSYLFVGVKNGQLPTYTNRFLMQGGLEIYDISIWERPVRLAQLPSEQPVTGLDLIDDLLFMANGSNGLVKVDISDLTRPLAISSLPFPGHQATDVSIHSVNKVVAVAAANGLGTGFVRFISLDGEEYDSVPGYGTVYFNEDSGDQNALLGQPLDVQWLGDTLFVLLKRNQQLFVVELSGFGDSLSQRVYPIARGVVSASNSEISSSSFLVQQGQITVSTGHEFLVLEYDTSVDSWDTVYWQESQISETEIFHNGGYLFFASEDGVDSRSGTKLVISEVTPMAGSKLSNQDRIRVMFNSLLNTDETHLAANIRILMEDGSEMSADAYDLEGTNAVNGAYIDVTFNQQMAYSGQIRLQIGEGLADIQGRLLHQSAEYQYQLQIGFKPQISTVSRVTESGLQGHFFHADGTEQGVILGNNFGVDSALLAIKIGDIQLTEDAIQSVTDTEIQFDMPPMLFGNAAVSLPVSVTRIDQDLSYIHYGAVTILPQIEIDDFSPRTGPPQGGNRVDLYGRGFSYGAKVKFAGALAGDLRVISSNHISVRAPAGSFGEAEISIENPLFLDESVVSTSTYFYTGQETGSVDLSTDKPSPVSAMALTDQLMYAVTGGHYDLITAAGDRQRLTTNTARLMLVDLSDPVNPQVLEKQFAENQQAKPYHFEVSGGINPSGFVDVAIDDNYLQLIGGRKLYHFDRTLSTDPLLLQTVALSGDARDLVFSQGLSYISTSEGIEIYRVLDADLVQQVATINTTILGGIPGAIALDNDSLWVALPNAQRIVELELVSGEFNKLREFSTEDLAGNLITPASLLVHGQLLLVSTGETATVQLYTLNSDTSGVPVASVALNDVVQGGVLSAGAMSLQGQTLYVSAGAGDLQLYNIASWLNGDFLATVPLRDYFALTGSVKTHIFHPDALYAGTAYVVSAGEALESPIPDNAGGFALSGALNTIADPGLTIVSQTPLSLGALSINDAVEIQFNGVLDYNQIEQLGDSLVTLSLDGIAVEAFVSQRTNNQGSLLVIRPAQPLEPGKNYSVTLSGELSELNGKQLGEDYQFNFVSEDNTSPVLESVQPQFGSWRGGELITLTGQGFGPETEITVAGVQIPASDSVFFNDTSISFVLPSLLSAPSQNLLVGISVANGSFEHFKPAAFTYITNPQVTSLGHYDRGSDRFYSADKIFNYSAGEYIGIKGTGLGLGTRVRINQSEINNIQIEAADLISVPVPDSTIGTLQIELSNSDFSDDTITDNSLEIRYSAKLQLAGIPDSTHKCITQPGRKSGQLQVG